MKHELNKKQAIMLFNDLLKGELKMLGQFNINKYRLSIYDKTLESGTQRVMALYNRRKEKGVCVTCCKIIVDGFTRCKSCRDKQNKQRRR